MPLISVIIPFYNAEQYISESLGSVCKQSLEDIEIICIDDGSTDKTFQLLEEYALADSRIKIIHQENKGAGAARNVGLKLANGEYLSFLDADDIYEEQMLKAAYNKAIEEQAEIVLYQSDNYDDQTKTIIPHAASIRYDLLPDSRPFAGMDVKKDIFGSIIGWAWDKLYKTSYIKDTGLLFQEQKSTNDAFFVFCSFAAAERISTCDRVLVHHRVNVKSSISSTREKSWQCFYYALIAMRDFLKDRELYDRFETDYINYALHFSLWHLQTLKEPQKEQLYNILKKKWFRELEIESFSRNQFYKKNQYIKYKIIKVFPYSIGSLMLYCISKKRSIRGK